jgi:CAAX prenyl protease N-terminal, five membrane helices
MTITETHLHPDTPETREYNRQRRWLEIGDLVVSFGFLIALLATGWTKTLSGLATRMGRDHYALDLFYYVLFLSVISKALGFALDLYGFRLEHRFNLSNQRLFSWIKDEIKGWLLGLVMATMLAEIVYALIRTSPEYWWIICLSFSRRSRPWFCFRCFTNSLLCKMMNSRPASCAWVSAPALACAASMNGSSQKKARRPTPP